MKKLLIFAVLALPQFAYADLEMDRLLGLEITIGSTTISGYGIGTSYWPTTDDVAMLQRFRTEKAVSFLKDIFPVSYPVKSFVATSQIIQIPTGTITSIKRLPKPHDGYEWYGVLNVYPQWALKLLQQPPTAQCEVKPGHNEDSASETFFLSYNKEYPLEKLNDLCVGPFAGYMQPNEALTSQRVFRFDISGD
jgi:hypothetical protein